MSTFGSQFFGSGVFGDFGDALAFEGTSTGTSSASGTTTRERAQVEATSTGTSSASGTIFDDWEHSRTGRTSVRLDRNGRTKVKLGGE